MGHWLQRRCLEGSPSEPTTAPPKPKDESGMSEFADLWITEIRLSDIGRNSK